jgi:hypothetical protein
MPALYLVSAARHVDRGAAFVLLEPTHEPIADINLVGGVARMSKEGRRGTQVPAEDIHGVFAVTVKTKRC